MVGSIISWAQVFHPCRSSNFVWVVDEWIQKFFLSAKDRNCLASIKDANGDCGIQEAAGLKKDTSSFIPFWPWSLGPMDEVGGSIVVVVLNSSRRPSEKKLVIIFNFTEHIKVSTACPSNFSRNRFYIPFLKEIFGLGGNSCTVSDGSGWCKSDSRSFLLKESTKRSEEEDLLVKSSSSSMTSYFGPYSPPGAKIGQSYRVAGNGGKITCFWQIQNENLYLVLRLLL